MTPLQIVLGAILIAAALFLIVVIMLQDKAKRGLGGAISGSAGASSYAGKTAVGKKGKLLSRVTTIVAIVFVVIVLFAFLFT